MTMNNMTGEYAEALFALACENNSLKEYSSSLNTVLGFMEESPQYVELLASPSIPIDERLEAIDAAFGDLLPEHVLSFLKILCERQKIRGLRDCVREYDALLDACRNVSAANVISALELTQQQKDELKSKLEKMSGKDVVMNCSVDKSLIGGIVVEIDGRVIDGSLRHSLSEVKDVMGK